MFLNLLGAAEGALIRAAALTQTLDASHLNHQRMKKPKIIYCGAALLTFIIGVALAGIFVLPQRTFKAVSRDGAAGPGLGSSGKGTGMAVTTWVYSDGVTIEELTVGYSSKDDARRDFELEESRAERIPGQNAASNSERVVGKYGPSYRPSFKVITLDEKQLHYVQGSDLDAVLAFEASWFKSEWW